MQRIEEFRDRGSVAGFFFAQHELDARLERFIVDAGIGTGEGDEESSGISQSLETITIRYCDGNSLEAEMILKSPAFEGHKIMLLKQYHFLKRDEEMEREKMEREIESDMMGG